MPAFKRSRTVRPNPLAANMRSMPARPRLLFALMLALALPAGGTVMLALSTEDLVKQSSLVAVAEVRSVRVERHRSTIVTKAELGLSRVFFGAEPGDTVTVIVPGGEIGELGQRVRGAPSLTEGETCVVFLESAGASLFQFVGLGQGKLEITPDPDVEGGWIVHRAVDAHLMQWLNGELVDAPHRPPSEPLMPLLRRLEELVPQP